MTDEEEVFTDEVTADEEGVWVIKAEVKGQPKPVVKYAFTFVGE